MDENQKQWHFEVFDFSPNKNIMPNDMYFFVKGFDPFNPSGARNGKGFPSIIKA